MWIMRVISECLEKIIFKDVFSTLNSNVIYCRFNLIAAFKEIFIIRFKRYNITLKSFNQFVYNICRK